MASGYIVRRGGVSITGTGTVSTSTGVTSLIVPDLIGKKRFYLLANKSTVTGAHAIVSVLRWDDEYIVTGHDPYSAEKRDDYAEFLSFDESTGTFTITYVADNFSFRSATFTYWIFS